MSNQVECCSVCMYTCKKIGAVDTCQFFFFGEAFQQPGPSPQTSLQYDTTAIIVLQAVQTYFIIDGQYPMDGGGGGGGGGGRVTRRSRVHCILIANNEVKVWLARLLL